MLSSLYLLIKNAIKAVPAVRYALGVSGIVSVIAIVRVVGLDYKIALFGVLIMIALMVLLLTFSVLANSVKGKKPTIPPIFKWPILILLWSQLILTVSSGIFLFASAFFDWPLQLKSLINAPATAEKNLKADTREMSEFELKAWNDMSPRFDENCPLEIAALDWDKKGGFLDIKLRNKTDDSLILSQMVVYLTEIQPIRHLPHLPPALTPEFFASGYEKLRRGYHVSYVIPPKGVDRYLLPLKEEGLPPNINSFMLWIVCNKTRYLEEGILKRG